MRIALYLFLGLLVILILLPFNWSKYDLWSIIAVIVSLVLTILYRSTSILKLRKRITEQKNKIVITDSEKAEIQKMRIRCPRCNDVHIYRTHRK